MDSEIEVTWTFYVRLTTAWVLVFWSCVIGPEQPGQLWGDGIAVEQPVVTIPSGSGGKLSQKNLGNKDPATIDRDAFLISYKRQARAQLDACLQSWKPSPGQATFVAVLHKKTGRLSNLEILGDNTELPGCIASITAAMDFAAVATSMTGENVVLQWTTDW